MQTQLISRIQDAICNGEDAILDQIYSDIETAQLLGSIDTMQYDMIYSGDCVYIHDKIHDEYTKAFTDDREVILRSMDVDDKVYSLMEDGQLIAFGNKLSLIPLMRQFSNSRIDSSVDVLEYYQEKSQRSFANTYGRFVVMDSNGNTRGIFNHIRAMNLIQNPGWSAVSVYKYNQTKYNN